MAWFRTGTGESLDADLATQKIDIESLASYIADIMQDANGIYVWGKYTAQNGDLLDYVHDENKNTYPDGGTKNGFWYKRPHSAFTNIEVTTMPSKTTYNILYKKRDNKNNDNHRKSIQLRNDHMVWGHR